MSDETDRLKLAEDCLNAGEKSDFLGDEMKWIAAAQANALIDIAISLRHLLQHQRIHHSVPRIMDEL